MPTSEAQLREGKVDVKWRFNDKTATYRRGFDGKMDLKAVEASFGGRYKPEWLPVFEAITKEETWQAVKLFSDGDRVKIVADTVRELREKQAGHGGWVESMAKVNIN